MRGPLLARLFLAGAFQILEIPVLCEAGETSDPLRRVSDDSRNADGRRGLKKMKYTGTARRTVAPVETPDDSGGSQVIPNEAIHRILDAERSDADEPGDPVKGIGFAVLYGAMVWATLFVFYVLLFAY